MRNKVWLPFSTPSQFSQNLTEVYYILKGKKSCINPAAVTFLSVEDEIWNMWFLHLSMSFLNNNPVFQLVSSLLIRQANIRNYKVTIFKEESNPFFIHW